MPFQPKPTEQELAAAGNGDMLAWHEYEADVGRAQQKLQDWIGGHHPDAPTNTEMAEFNRRQTMKYYRVTMKWGHTEEHELIEASCIGAAYLLIESRMTPEWLTELKIEYLANKLIKETDDEADGTQGSLPEGCGSTEAAADDD